jgi:predicted XRE-type DNA-binding protein
MPYRDPIPDLKRFVADEIVRLIEGWPGYKIAGALDTDQPRVSDLRNGRLDRFSLEKLIRMLHHLGFAIEPSVVQWRPSALVTRRPPRPPVTENDKRPRQSITAGAQS